MNTEISLPDEVQEEEILGRSIAKTSEEAKARRGVIVRSVFLDKRPAKLSLSVDRMDHAPRTEMAAIAADREAQRKPPRRFRGWALVTADGGSNTGRMVKASKKDGNPYHADICLNIGSCDSDEILRLKKEHAQELASHSTWEAAPKTG